MIISELIARSVETWKKTASMLKRAPLFPISIIALFAFLAILADFITPYSPIMPELPNRLQPPFWLEGGSMAHLLGTDTMGRDMVTRLIYGARISLSLAALSILLGGLVGTAIGLISGYFGGPIEMPY